MPSPRRIVSYWGKKVNNNINKDRSFKIKNNEIINPGVQPSLQPCKQKSERFISDVAERVQLILASLFFMFSFLV